MRPRKRLRDKSRKATAPIPVQKQDPDKVREYYHHIYMEGTTA